MNSFHDIQEILGTLSPIEMAQIILGMEGKIGSLQAEIEDLTAALDCAHYVKDPYYLRWQP